MLGYKVKSTIVPAVVELEFRQTIDHDDGGWRWSERNLIILN